jgi:hypothetical protein
MTDVHLLAPSGEAATFVPHRTQATPAGPTAMELTLVTVPAGLGGVHEVAPSESTTSGRFFLVVLDLLKIGIHDVVSAVAVRRPAVA